MVEGSTNTSIGILAKEGPTKESFNPSYIIQHIFFVEVYSRERSVDPCSNIEFS